MYLVKTYFKMALVASALLSITGCQSTGDSTEVKQEQNASASVISTFDELNKQYILDQQKFDSASVMNIYSEQHYEVMMDKWNEAKNIYSEIKEDPSLINKDYSMFSSETYAAKYMALIVNANTELAVLNKYKKKADVVLSDAISQMSYINSIDVNKYYPQDFLTLSSEYKELFVTLIEEDIAETQTEQAEFLTKAKDIEIKTVLTIYVKPLEKEFSSLSNEGFENIAPISYGQTKAELAKTKTVVEANNRDQELITDAVAKTKFQINHLKNMAAEVKLLKAVEDGKFEQTVLAFESKLLSVSQVVNGQDYRDQPLRVQTDSIVSAVQLMHDKNNTLDLEATIKDLTAQIKTFKTDAENQQKEHDHLQSKMTALTEQLELNDSLVTHLNSVIATYKEKEAQMPAFNQQIEKIDTKPAALVETNQVEEVTAPAPVSSSMVEPSKETEVAPATEQPAAA